MGQIVFVIGGCRSGKSRYAQARAEALPQSRVYIATCPATDDEMRARVARHQADRAAAQWQTVEEHLDPAAAIRALDGATVLLDCLTVWVSNLMYAREQENVAFDEDHMAAAAADLVAAARAHDGTVLVVTNEVGLGIVPDNAVARRYRDLAGRCNQTVAAAADEAVLLVSGLPVTLKPPS